MNYNAVKKYDEYITLNINYQRSKKKNGLDIIDI
jgi:hypothetical protein